MTLTGCGGGASGSSSIPSNPGVSPTTPSNPSAKTSSSSVKFVIPLSGLRGVTDPNPQLINSQSVAKSVGSKRSPQFIDASSNGGLTVILDAQKIVNNVTFAPNGNVTEGQQGPQGNGLLPNGGSYTYSVTYTYTNSQSGAPTTANSGSQPYADFAVNYTTIPGKHMVGIVQTNGPCEPDTYGRELCIPTTEGYVLAEGQQTFTLQPGTNLPQTMVLRGVLQSTYFCDAACDGGPFIYDAVKGYQFSVYVADENGDTIPHQIDPITSLPVPFDNGSYQIWEPDGAGIVTITQPSPTGIYTAPGTMHHGGLYGEDISITCNKVGETTVVAQLVPGGPSAGTVTGFPTTVNNYPAANSILGSVGADQYFGNTLSLSCTATGSLTVI